MPEPTESIGKLRIASLELRAFRNFSRLNVDLDGSVNVFAGDNGQGKTNLLEAMYVVCTTRSFRTRDATELIQHASDVASVSASLVSGNDIPRAQSVGFGQGARRLSLAGKPVRSLTTYAEASPVVVFEPKSLVLTQGGAVERRRLLDRVGFHWAVKDEGSAVEATGDLSRYREALTRRRRALSRRDDPRVLEALESILATHGSRIAARRAATVERLRARIVEAFTSIARLDEALTLALVRRGPADAESLARALHDRREDDLRRGTATVGPHLDDLDLQLGGRSFRSTASQGQHRMLVLAIASAELASLTEARGVSPILLLDDVSSELDPQRNTALFKFLDGMGGQVVVTTARRDTLALRGNFREFRVVQGRIEP